MLSQTIIIYIFVAELLLKSQINVSVIANFTKKDNILAQTEMKNQQPC